MSDETTSPPMIHKCGTSNCPLPAEYYAAWPGQPMKFCQPCLDRAKHIAEVMGFALPWSRIKQAANPISRAEVEGTPPPQ